MSANPQHFATVVLDAFRAARLFTVEQIVEAGGPSTTTLTKLRKAAKGSPMARPRGDTMRKIDTAAEWPDGSAMVLWETNELPADADIRAIGSGGVPAPEAWIQSSAAEVEQAESGVRYRALTKAVDRAGRESTLELVFTPARDQEIALADLGPVASMAHKEAIRWTYAAGTRVSLTRDIREGGDGNVDAADAGDSTSTKPATRGQYAKAAREGSPTLKGKRAEHDRATEAPPEDPTGMEPI